MKNKIKLTLSLLLILCITAVLMLAGCGEKEITDAYITNSDLPRTSYVEGQELDLSKGYLTLIRGGEEAKIPFSAEGIEVSGYDCNTVGQQTVTVTYGEVSTTFTVTVTPRIIAENFETKYFVGDTFNKTKGRVKVAGDDGKVKNVNFSDKAVSVVSFDTTSAGKKTVTVKYTSGSVSYECSFEVTVYEVAGVSYTPPQKVNYYSHNAKVEDKDVKDGYFTVTSADGSLTGIVPVNADMVKGYDPSVATIANRKEGAAQRLTIEYLGQSYDYEIKIIFSGVSIVNYYAYGELNGINLSGKLNATQKEASYDALSELLKLTPAEKVALEDATVNKVVATAAVGVMDLFMTKLNTYGHAFAMNESGELGLTGVNYTAASIALTDLLDSNSEINGYVKALRQLVADYGKTTVTAGETVADVVIVYSEEMENLLLPILQHLVTVHELLMNVPDEWTVEDLKANSTNIIDAILEIKDAGYYQLGQSVFYTDILSKWRTKDDLIDLIYSFALYAYEGSEDFMQTNLFGKFPMPGTLEDLYEQLMNTYNLQYSLYQNQYADAWLSDLSKYATSYFLTLDFANVVKNSGNQFWLDIYNAYNMDYIVAAYTSAQNFGFEYHAGPMLDSENFKTLWSQYYAVLQLYLTNNLDAKTHEELIFALIDTFQTMTPNEVYGFLCSLNLNYGEARGSSSVLYIDFVENFEANIFATIVREYYCTYLTDANVAIVSNLLLAIESAALFGENEETLANFVGFMEMVKTAREALTDADDIENFEKYLGKSYYKYLDMYKRIIGEELDKKPTEEELKLINQLRADMAKYEEVYNYVSGLTNITDAHYYIIYAAYAKATETYNTFMSTASDAALTVFFTEGYVFLERSVTVAKAYFQIDKATTSMMQGAVAVEIDGKYTVVSHAQLLTDYGMLSLYADLFDLLYFTLVDDTATPDAEYVSKLAKKIAALGEVEAMLFEKFGAAPVYYAQKCAYLQSTLKNDAAALAVADALADVAAKYDEYTYNYSGATYLEAFLTAFEAAKASYNALTADAKTALGEIYDYYAKLAEELTPAA